MSNQKILSSLKEVREDVRAYLDTGYDADVEISNVICGKLDCLINEVEHDRSNIPAR